MGEFNCQGMSCVSQCRPSTLLQFTGILGLGLGDAAVSTVFLARLRESDMNQASIVGRGLGSLRWSATTAKTLEGSCAFVVSVLVATEVLGVLGYVEGYSVGRQRMGYIGGLVVSGLLEALSEQNDNLTLPLFMWSVLVVGM